MSLENRNTKIWLSVLAGIVLLGFVLNPDRLPDSLMRWMTIASAGATGWVAGWFLSPAGKRARKVALTGLIAVVMLLVFIAPPVMGWSLTFMVAAVVFTIAIMFWLGGAVRSAISWKPTTFGSAEWATLDYLRAHEMVGDTGLRLGQFSSPEGEQPLHYDGDRHLLTIAPTRSGKGTTLIIPNLLTYRGSALVIDPKGENAMITADQRAAMGQTVHVVDPWLITGMTPARFNPLDWLVPGDPDITENAMLLADALIVSDGKGEAFWVEEAKALLQGLILYVATDERERGRRHLGRVRDLLLLDGVTLPHLFHRMTESPHHVIASTGARCLQKDDKLLANVLASAQAQTHFLDSARIRENLSVSDFRFEDLKAGKTTIYLVLPADRLTAFGRWLRLLIQQAITVNARDIATKPDKPVLFLLDEMPALGRLSTVEQAYGLMAGFGMQLWGIVQDAAQLRHIYGQSWEGFVANSGAITYSGSRDRMTADYFSALCGVTTVWNISSAISHAFGGGSSSSTNSQTTSAVQRPLIFADELMRLHRTRQLILIENLNPIQASRKRWFEDDALAARGRNLHRERAGQ